MVNSINIVCTLTSFVYIAENPAVAQDTEVQDIEGGEEAS